MRNHNFFVFIAAFIFCLSCYSQQEISSTFYITANTGLTEKNSSEAIFREINRASQNDASANLLLLGNITPKNGYPEGDLKRQATQQFLKNNLLDPLENFNGDITLIPGVNEWNPAAPQSIDDLESYLQDNSQSEFWPNDGCPLREEVLNDEVVLITIDSQWFLENWDDHPEMNLDCEIKNREQLFIEFQDDLKDNHGKTKIVVIHHPVMSNSRYGFLNRIGAFSTQAFEHQKQRNLRGRLETIASLYDDVIFVSGNHRNLQFLDNERNPQIISGAAAKTEPAKAKDEEHFASDSNGYARLIIYSDGSSKVEFFEVSPEGSSLLFNTEIARERPRLEDISYEQKEDPGPTIMSSIYTPEETDKSRFHTWLLGETNREIFSTEIEASVLNIDTLPGNLTPLKEGGGQQSRSLRFIGEDEHEYTIRALRKSPLRYVQADLVKDTYIANFLDNTIVYRYLTDFFTTSHPYAPFAINDLYDPLNIYHVDPEIYYVPKQPALGIHNDEYGDELYMLEPHVGDENKEFEFFGAPDDILSTLDLLLELRENKDAYVNESAFIKVRLFDLLVGDWDRHADQWRWSEFEMENGEKEYYPIPRDRDFAFPNYGGILMAFLKQGIPEMRKMQSYEKEIKNLKWLTWSGYVIDKSLINTANLEDWEEQARFIQENLTDEVIEEAFAALPTAVQGPGIDEIIENLKYRRDNLVNIARSYYDYFKEFEVVRGTEENDRFEIIRNEDGSTKISITTEDDQHFTNTYYSDQTEEIWIYGLDGKDTFNISGSGSDLIKLKVIGGTDHDVYDFATTKKAKIYDYKSQENTITNSKSKKWLVDSYDINTYDYTKRKYSEYQLLPYADFVPDAGFSIGVRNIFTTYGLARNPFTTQHRLGANYYFATNGYELNYSGEFAHIFYNWNFAIEGRYTSPNYFINYFGTGNNTIYDRDAVARDYNRAQIQQWHVAPSLVWRNEAGSSFYVKPMIEAQKVVSHGGFISDNFSPENDIFDHQLYGGAEMNFNYYNKNNASFPSRGMEFNLTTGYKQNIDEHDNSFGYVEPSLSFDYPLIPSGFAVVATKIGGEAIIGDNYEFYHAATIGGNDNLRGYRNHRFNGKRSFYHSTDLRSAVALLETRFIPLIVGVTAGFDYGRVWSDQDESNRWRNNYGGSIWINALYTISGSVGLYHGDDGNRFAFMLNFKY